MAPNVGLNGANTNNNMELEALKRKRGGVRARLTVICKKFVEAMEKDECSVLVEYEGVFDMIGSKMEELDNLIHPLLKEDTLELDTMESLDRQETVIKYRNKVNNYRLKIECIKNSKVELKSESLKQNDSRVKLPKLSIKPFDGDYLSFTTFIQTFNNTINFNRNLSNIEKFAYLKTFLIGKAEQAIEGLEITDANYEKAISILTERFGNPERIIESHISGLMNLKKPFTSTNSLRIFYDKCVAHVRALEALDVLEDKYNVVVGPSLIKKLPMEMGVEWYKKCDIEKTGIKTSNFIQFLKLEVQAREHMAEHFDNERKQDFSVYKPTVSFNTTTSPKFQQLKAKCLFCDSENHYVTECLLNNDEKLDAAKKKGLCFNCLKPSHLSVHCKSKSVCRNCQHRHHTSLCFKKFGNKIPYRQQQHEINDSTSETKAETVDQIASLNTTVTTEKKVVLQTIVTIAVGPKNIRKRVRAVMDTASHRSFITETLADELKLSKTVKENITIQTLGNNPKNMNNTCSSKIILLSKNQKLNIDVLHVPKICGELQNGKFNDKQMEELNGLNLADIDATSGNNLEIDMLIGADYYWSVMNGEIKRLESGLILMNSKFGYVLSGSVETLHDGKLTALFLHSETNIDNMLRTFWEIENVACGGTVELDPAVKIFEESVTFTEGRYEVRLPWKDDRKGSLNNNYSAAMYRLKKLLGRSTINELKEYDKVIQQYVSSGVAEKVHYKKEGMHYLPHQGVRRFDSPTTPLRVVFDASTGLNDCLHCGPSLIPDLVSILLKFKLHHIGICADIEKAFLQISLAECDRDYVRFIWINFGKYLEDKTIEFQHFRLARVLFGVNCSPYLLSATINHHLGKYMKNKTAKLLKDNLYVDDLICGAQTTQEAVESVNEIKTIFSEANMNIRKWRTNCKWTRELIKGDPVSDVNVLGVKWTLDDDSLQAHIKVKQYSDNVKVTKRIILSSIGQIFDPLGYVSPFVMMLKIIFQGLWVKGFEWDEELPLKIQDNWKKWINEAKAGHVFKHQRKLYTNNNYLFQQLHVFCDASQVGYAAVAYLRVVYGDHTEVKFVMSRARLAPLKKVTIPRLELLAAVMGVHLAKYITENLHIDIKTTIFWTDARNVLYWIKDHSGNWKQFVTNRIQKIQSVVCPNQWKYVPGPDNPADVPSRGMLLSKLIKCCEWKNGPQWLKLDEDQWPIQKQLEVEPKERKTNLVINTMIIDIKTLKPLFKLESFSNLNRVLRVTAYVFRWTQDRNNARNRSRFIRADELEEALVYWCKVSQLQKWHDIIKKQNGFEKDKDLRLLKPFVNEKGLLLARGRITSCESLTEEARNPIILPSDHYFTKLIIQDAHERNRHGGVRDTLTDLRTKYFINRGRQRIKSIIRHCVTCQKHQSGPYQVEEPELPSDRLNATYPFEVTGLDYAGPLYLKDRDNKHYILLATCAVTRAVHLELLPDMTAETCLLALKRFFARRGLSKIIYSDNAQTFKRVKRELQLSHFLDDETTAAFLAKNNIDWKFIAPHAPWWGGWWERLVRSIKLRLKKSLGKASITFEECLTVLIQIESLLNTRPLTYVHNSPEEPLPLTPMHFLIGRMSNQINQEKRETEEVTTRSEYVKRVRHREEIMKKFWKRWQLEYLNELRNFKLNGKEKRIIKEGDIVLEMRDDRKRGKWKLAKVVEIHVGRGGIPRSAKIRTSDGMVERAVQRLIPLEISSP